MAIKRYAGIINGTSAKKGIGLRNLPKPSGELRTLTIRVAAEEGVLNATDFPQMNESFDISITNAKPDNFTAVLRAETTLGALHGLETFAQLIDFSVVPPRIAASPIHVNDEPRFQWRGLRLDTARHYLPVSIVKRTIDAMAAVKLNVLMWHIVDGQSFPLQLSRFPELSAKGAYCAECVYTEADVRAIVEHARQLGVRVVPEIDVPGHSGFQYGRADLVACPTLEEFRGAGRALDPTQDKVYTFLHDLFTDVTALFPDPVFNFCGDEVQFECFDSNPRIRDWVRAHGNMSYFDLEQHFWTRMNEPGGVIPAVFTAKGKTVIVSEGSSPKQGSVNLTRFPSGTIAEVWGQLSLSQGLRSILRNNTDARAILGGPYYLDVAAPFQQGEPNATKHYYAWMDTWQNFYAAEPFADPLLTPDEQARVSGRQVQPV
jgi:hexosaminidase